MQIGRKTHILVFLDSTFASAYTSTGDPFSATEGLYRLHSYSPVLLLKDLVYEAKAKPFLRGRPIKDMAVFQGQCQSQDFIFKAKDMKIFQGQGQCRIIISRPTLCQLRELPLRHKICIAVTETEYA